MDTLYRRERTELVTYIYNRFTSVLCHVSTSITRCTYECCVNNAPVEEKVLRVRSFASTKQFATRQFSAVFLSLSVSSCPSFTIVHWDQHTLLSPSLLTATGHLPPASNRTTKHKTFLFNQSQLQSEINRHLP